MSYSRTHPSKRYLELQELNKFMHLYGSDQAPPEQMFSGSTCLLYAPRIKEFLQTHPATSLLDYGSGKGVQYGKLATPLEEGPHRYYSLQEYWQLDTIVCYDPCYVAFSQLPATQHDLVITTDMLEHCPEEDIPWVLEEIFSLSKKSVFATAASYLAGKTLPNGENAHCTIKPTGWWKEMFTQVGNKFPLISYKVCVEYAYPAPNQLKFESFERSVD